MPTDNFGERAATEDEVEDWIEFVKTGFRASKRKRWDPKEEEIGLQYLPVQSDD